MNKNELNQAFEAIHANDGTKERIYSELTENHTPKAKAAKKKAAWTRRLVATAATLAVLAVPGTIYADEIKDFFTGVLNKDEQVAEYVQQNIFEDSDGHLKLMVKELLSDQKDIRAIVAYEALDEEGMEWIKTFNADDYRSRGIHGGNIGINSLGIYHSALSLEPNAHVSCSYGFAELEKFRTDTTLCLQFLVDIAEPAELSTASLYYPMTHELCREAVLDVSANMDIREYKLVGDTNVNKYYDVSYVRLTNLSCIIYGNQKGMWESWNIEGGGYGQRSLIPDDEMEQAYTRNVTLHLKDGTEFTPSASWTGGALYGPPKDEEAVRAAHHDADTLIMSVAYNDEQLSDNMEGPEIFMISPDDVVGITINDTYFTLEEYK